MSYTGINNIDVKVDVGKCIQCNSSNSSKTLQFTVS